MKRCIELIRKILIMIEEDELSSASAIDSYSQNEVLYHIVLLHEAGFIECVFKKTDQEGIVDAYVKRLTWDGHEFLDNARNDNVWNKAKEKIGNSIGTVSLSVWSEVLKQVAESLFSA